MSFAVSKAPANCHHNPNNKPDPNPGPNPKSNQGLGQVVLLEI